MSTFGVGSYSQWQCTSKAENTLCFCLEAISSCPGPGTVCSKITLSGAQGLRSLLMTIIDRS